MRQVLPVVLALSATLVACGAADETGDERASNRDAASGADEQRTGGGRHEGESETVVRARCPDAAAGCRSASGRVVYVERHDPDGDGDAHFVIDDPQGITLPGLTVIDVRADLRPQPLPGPGDLISAAGPVQTGSYGQSQIHALRLNVAGR